MCENTVMEFIGNHEIQIKCGYVFINHLKNVEIARCPECRHKPRFLHEYVQPMTDDETNMEEENTMDDFFDDFDSDFDGSEHDDESGEYLEDGIDYPDFESTDEDTLPDSDNADNINDNDFEDGLIIGTAIGLGISEELSEERRAQREAEKENKRKDDDINF